MIADTRDLMWYSVHVDGPSPLHSVSYDRFLVCVIKPFVNLCEQRRWIADYFFVRYSEHGSHVRLRLRCEPATLRQQVRPALEEHLRTISAGSADASPASWREVPYEPEITRYGGPDAISVVEPFFCDSSAFALKVLSSQAGDRNARFGAALVSGLVLLHSAEIDVNVAASVMARYGKRFARKNGSSKPEDEGSEARCREQAAQLFPSLGRIWTELDRGCEFDDNLGQYARDCSRTMTRLRALFSERRLTNTRTQTPTWRDCVWQIGTSLMHMTNNRLGVSQAEETYIATVGSYLLDPQPVLVQ